MSRFYLKRQFCTGMRWYSAGSILSRVKLLEEADEAPVEEVEREQEEKCEGGDEGHGEDKLPHADVAETVGEHPGGGLVGDADEACADRDAKGGGQGRQADAGAEVEEEGGEDAGNGCGIRQEVEGDGQAGDGAQFEEGVGF